METPIMQALMFFLAALSSTIAATDTPFLVAHKKVALKRIDPTTERLSVSIDIYNKGSMSVFDVSLSDDSWNQDIFAFVSGNASNSWERLDAGALVSHSFELESKVKGMFYGAPAVVTYRIPTNTAQQVAYSNPTQSFDILGDKAASAKLDLAKRMLANYGPQVSVVSIIFLFGYIITTPSKSSVAQGSRKRR